MSIDPNAVGATADPVERSWGYRDSLLYAVGIGAGAEDPVGSELEFTTNNSKGIEQRTFPTQGVVIGGSGGALGKVGEIDWGRVLHGSQGVTLHQPIPVSGTVVIEESVSGIWDKGEGKNAIIETESKVSLKETHEPLFDLRFSIVVRGSGGFGGEEGNTAPQVHAPDASPDHEVTYQTRTDQALTYRLSGDYNPLHSDPWFATELGGFPKPILHGLCTYGFTGRALLHQLCDGDPSSFKSMDSRFSSPVYPGDSLTVQMWVEGGQAIYRTVAQKDTPEERVVIDNGLCLFA
ncbi:MAG TPA: enoyl-CoA hydratase [Acidimicrobiaceae bacterium]|jgi:acyl dehydratase|nr:enoyl-CoA hydratase [Acidimicrobiaceae bacterium]HBU39255.1 enoyl-CoA hydratase [Acidimicrobiaceae bacterium]|tara:strand:+ start:17163 stop:18038 length:876 start_codon:yes stop_codon:yes gene_type:complete